jgi:tetratricopeptide (TPR) repeat protein
MFVKALGGFQVNPDERACPVCGEAIKIVAQKCRYCGEWLKSGSTATDLAISPSAVPIPPSSKIDQTEVADLLGHLVARSLVVFDSPSGRYRLLETMRQYARDLLLVSSEGDPWRNRHRDHFLTLSEEAEPHLAGPEAAEWRERLETEYDNLRAALEWCAKSEDGGESGLRLCGAIWRFWHVRGHFEEARERCMAALAHPGAGQRTRARARALGGTGVMAVYQGNYEEARAAFEEAMEIHREAGDHYGEAHSLYSLGSMALVEGDYRYARPLLEQSFAMMKELGDRQGEAVCLSSLGGIAEEQGDLEEAQRFLEESLSICRELGDPVGEASALNNLGLVARRQGDLSLANSLHGQSLSICAGLRHPFQVAHCLYELGKCGEQTGRPLRAVRLLAAADTLLTSIGAPFKAYDREIIDAALIRLGATLGQEAFSAALVEGRALSVDQAIKLALEEPA